MKFFKNLFTRNLADSDEFEVVDINESIPLLSEQNNESSDSQNNVCQTSSKQVVGSLNNTNVKEVVNSSYKRSKNVKKCEVTQEFYKDIGTFLNQCAFGFMDQSDENDRAAVTFYSKRSNSLQFSENNYDQLLFFYQSKFL